MIFSQLSLFNFSFSRFDFCSDCKSKPSDCVNRVSLPNTKDMIEVESRVFQYTVDSSVRNSGFAHSVVMWWLLDMDVDGEISLSTAPRWAHPHSNKRQVMIGFMS